ncbi:MAG TPA: hypothetical protein VHW64_11695 [Nocardioides sp.]|uniref:hypothetical protein n=1 Tax=Nocardioides sp. TaxID=35761 RepID=UPI002E32AC59|nr:hypothetical protein [Nocardioides sp.]HEX3931363.1 hypothetical protein [Nocardioides sp.]
MRLPGRSEGRVSDPVVVGLIALLVCGLHGFDGPLGHDQGAFVYGGERFAHGAPPYVGIFNSIGPLVDVATGVGVRLGWALGLDPVLAARLTYLVISALAAAVLSALAREALRSRLAGWVAPAVLLTFESFTALASDGPRDKTLMLLLLEAALLLLVRRQWLWAGALTALATLTWQPVVLAAVTAAVVAAVTMAGSRVRGLTRYVAGGAVPTVLAGLLFLVSGHLRVAWWGFVLVNVGYTSQPNILQSWRLLTHAYDASLVLVVLGWLALLVLGALAASRLRRSPSPDGDRDLVALAAGGLVAGVWTCYAINGGPDLFVVLPFAAIGVAALTLRCVDSISSPARVRVATAVVVTALVAATVQSVSTRSNELAGERASVDRVVAALPPGAVVLSIDVPEVPALLQRRNPYPWQLFNSAMTPFLDDHLAGGLPGLAARISARHPELIAVGRVATDSWLRHVLRTDYRPVGAGEYWTWYASRRLDSAVIRRVRLAVG